MSSEDNVRRVTQLVAATLVAFVGYQLGRKHDHEQMRHEAAAKVIMELRRRILELEREFGPWVFASAEDEDYAMKKAEQIADLLKGLSRYHKENVPWLELRTIEKLQPIMSGYPERALQHFEVVRGGETGPEAEETREELRRWVTQDLMWLNMDLEEEARRVIGSGRHSTWWRRPISMWRMWRRLMRRLSRSHRR